MYCLPSSGGLETGEQEARAAVYACLTPGQLTEREEGMKKQIQSETSTVLLVYHGKTNPEVQSHTSLPGRVCHAQTAQTVLAGMHHSHGGWPNPWRHPQCRAVSWWVKHQLPAAACQGCVEVRHEGAQYKQRVLGAPCNQLHQVVKHFEPTSFVRLRQRGCWKQRQKGSHRMDSMYIFNLCRDCHSRIGSSPSHYDVGPHKQRATWWRSSTINSDRRRCEEMTPQCGVSERMAQGCPDTQSERLSDTVVQQTKGRQSVWHLGMNVSIWWINRIKERYTCNLQHASPTCFWLGSRHSGGRGNNIKVSMSTTQRDPAS